MDDSELTSVDWAEGAQRMSGAMPCSVRGSLEARLILSVT